MSNKNILIIGHGRHGKDTVGEILRDKCGFSFTSSSMFCAEEVIWDNWGCAVYSNFDEMYQDRSNHRKLWAEMISAYNTPDKSKTATGMITRGHNMYVGMRMRDEFEACIDKGLFDNVIWVDRSKHLPPEPIESMELTRDDANIFIDNNGSLQDLFAAVDNMLAANDIF